MATAREQLAQLDREFNAPHSAMHVDDYRARYEELSQQAIVERQSAGAEAAGAAAPLPAPEKPVSWGFVCKMLAAIRNEQAARKAMEARIAELEGGSVAKLCDIMSSPVRTIHDASGKVIGAERMLSPPTGAAKTVAAPELGLAEMERRLAALEERPTLKYRGVYDGGVSDYAGGDMVTWKGQLWYCLQATKERPGECSAWKLMHKTGKQ